MLDVGVGLGRTTPYFAPVVASYVGIDYSLPMVESCIARLGDRFSNVSLDVGDVRDLGRFAAGSFDFVLFSYNGLDSIGHDDRLIALAELRRVTDAAGYIFFSSHNLLWLDEPLSPGTRGGSTSGPQNDERIPSDPQWQTVCDGSR